MHELMYVASRAERPPDCAQVLKGFSGLPKLRSSLLQDRHGMTPLSTSFKHRGELAAQSAKHARLSAQRNSQLLPRSPKPSSTTLRAHSPIQNTSIVGTGNLIIDTLTNAGIQFPSHRETVPARHVRCSQNVSEFARRPSDPQSRGHARARQCYRV